MAMQKFSKTMRVTQANLEKVHGDKLGVYRIKTDDDVLYVGKAIGGRLGDRTAEHKGKFEGGT